MAYRILQNHIELTVFALAERIQIYRAQIEIERHGVHALVSQRHRLFARSILPFLRPGIHPHRVPIVAIVAAEGVLILLQIALETLCAQGFSIYPNIVGVVHIEKPAEKWQGATVTRYAVNLFAVEGVESCRYCYLARLDIRDQLGTIGGTIIQHLALLKELRRGGRYPCNEEYRKNRTFYVSVRAHSFL